MTSPTTSLLVEADPHLSAVMSHYYCVRHDSQAATIGQQILPTYEMLLVFNFGPAVAGHLGDEPYVIHRTAVLGPLQKMLRYELPPGADLIVVNFTLNGFYRLLGKPLHELKQIPHELARFEELWQQLNCLTTLEGRLHWISDYMTTHLTPIDEATRSLLTSIPYFGQTAVDPVKVVAQAQRVTSRHIQQRFQTHLGYSAKGLTRFLRFKQLLGQLRQQDPATVDWLTLVQTLGYYDQSHLIKDVQYFLGITPRQFLIQLSRGDLCISQTGKTYSSLLG